MTLAFLLDAPKNTFPRDIEGLRDRDTGLLGTVQSVIVVSYVHTHTQPIPGTCHYTNTHAYYNTTRTVTQTNTHAWVPVHIMLFQLHFLVSSV